MSERYAETTHANGYEFTQGSGYELPEYPFQAPPEIAAGAPSHHPIVIVGGGLAGLTAACALAQYGVRAVLLDEDNTVGVKGASSRGICYTQKSLEIFDRLGIYERIAAKGVQWSVGRTFAGEHEVYSFDLRQQGGFGLSAQPPFINIQQFYIEGFLVERIQELGHVDLRWRNRLTGFQQHADHAVLTVETPDGAYTVSSTTYDPALAAMGTAVATAATLEGMDLVGQQLDAARARLGDTILQTTTIDPQQAWGGYIVVARPRQRPPYDVDVSAHWNGEDYRFRFDVRAAR